MASDTLLQALRGSFKRLAEMLSDEFTSRLGQCYCPISLREVESCQEDGEFSSVVQLRLESTEDVVAALATHWIINAGYWVHTMGQSFPVLRGPTTVSVKRDILTSRPASIKQLTRTA